MGPLSWTTERNVTLAGVKTSKRDSPLRARALVMILLLAAPILCASCNRGNARADSPATLPPPLVTVATATANDVPRYLDEIGRNMAFESVSVTPQVAGRITERHFQDGENLKKGQLLFVIDPRPFQAQLDSAQANLAQAKAALELAKIQFSRDQELVGTRAISKQDYDTKKIRWTSMKLKWKQQRLQSKPHRSTWITATFTLRLMAAPGPASLMSET